MKQPVRSTALALGFAGLGAAAVVGWRVADPAPCRAGAVAAARVELLLGMGKKDGSEVSDAEWRAFLSSEVTPRFPDGLTVLPGYGQWRSSTTGALARESERVLLIWYKPNADSDRRIEQIRTAYKARFGQDSVMRVDGSSCVSF
jgi:Protein of unknown function (DUF3574)